MRIPRDIALVLAGGLAALTGVGFFVDPSVLEWAAGLNSGVLLLGVFFFYK
jgi:hypothetical protein